MALSATASIENDINFTLIKTGSNTQSESAQLNYSQSFTHGTGSLQINYGVISSGSLPSGGKTYVDLSGLSKESFGNTATVQFSKIKGIIVENNETVYGWDINVHATGSTAFTAPWNGSSGNVPVKPYAAWPWYDPISGAVVDSSNRQITLEDVCGSGARWTMVVIGITG